MVNRVRMPWKTIAESAYRAAYYAAQSVEGFGEPTELSEFKTTPVWHQVAWEAAVRQAVACSTVLLHETPPDERSWENWMPSALDGVDETKQPWGSSDLYIGMGIPMLLSNPMEPDEVSLVSTPLPPCEPSSSSVSE